VDVASVRYEELRFLRLWFDYEAIDKSVSNINSTSIVEKRTEPDNSITQLLFQQNALVFIKSTRYYNLYFLSLYS
jgi:hypothetical protein